jgi:hypothetical protein
MNAAMWDYNWLQFATKGEEYQEANTHEISAATEFIAYTCDKPIGRGREQANPTNHRRIDEKYREVEKKI